MADKYNITAEEVKVYYETQKKKERVLWAVIGICVAIWGADIYLVPGIVGPSVVELCIFLLSPSVIFLFVTKCPNCKRFGFKAGGVKGPGKCSVCEFPLQERV